MDNTLSGSVDVLPKLDWYVSVLGKIGSPEQAADLAQVRAAVAELIEATKKMQRPLAELAHNAVDAEGMMSTRPITDFATGDVGPDYIAMACSALTESVAALARVGGAK